MKSKSQKKTKRAPSAYAQAGVDIIKGDRFVSSIARLVQATQKKHGARIYRSASGYASLYRLNDQTFIAATTDGVGTKLKLAFASGKHSTVGIDLVAMSANDLLCVGAEPLFFLDYFATAKLNLKTSLQVMQGIAKGCQQAGLALVGGETAEMPGIYRDHEYDLAGFAVGLVNKKDLIDGRSCKAGDVVLALKSSGPHSNGFSLIRKCLARSKNSKLMQQCMAPTKIYSQAVSALRQQLKGQLKGLAHITGSGFLNIPRINANFDYLLTYDAKLFFSEPFISLKHLGQLSWHDMFTTFNMGVGMVAVVDRQSVALALKTLKAAKVSAHAIGTIEKKQKASSKIIITSTDFQLTLKY